MAVQLAAILLLVVGVYRFSLLWVSPQAASLAALASVFLGSESFLVYSARQLGTTSAAPIYLNALPYLFEWVRHGKWRSFVKASALFTAAAAAHHATLPVRVAVFCRPSAGPFFLVCEEGNRTATGSVLDSHGEHRDRGRRCDRRGAASLLDRVDTLSRDPDSDPPSQPCELHSKPREGV